MKKVKLKELKWRKVMKKIKFISEYMLDGCIISIFSIFAFCFICKQYIGLLLFIIPSIMLLGSWVIVSENEIIQYNCFKKKKCHVNDIESICLPEKKYKTIRIIFKSTGNRGTDFFIVDYFSQKDKMSFFVKNLSNKNTDCIFIIENINVGKDVFCLNL